MIILDNAEYALLFRNASRGILKGAPADLYPQMKDYVENSRAAMMREAGTDKMDRYRDEYNQRRRLVHSVTDARIKAILRKAETVDYNDLTNEERVMVRRIRDIIEGFKKERGME